MPSVADALKRLDQRSGLEHRPAIALTDRARHQRRRRHDAGAVAGACRSRAGGRAQAEGRLAVAPPCRRAIRSRCAALVLVLLVATFFAAATATVIAASLPPSTGRASVAPANYRIDAWVTPPQYTARPPVILPGLRPGEPARASAPIAVPAGSILVVRASGASGLDVALRGGIAVDDKPPSADGRSARRRHRGASLSHHRDRLR